MPSASPTVCMSCPQLVDSTHETVLVVDPHLGDRGRQAVLRPYGGAERLQRRLASTVGQTEYALGRASPRPSASSPATPPSRSAGSQASRRAPSVTTRPSRSCVVRATSRHVRATARHSQASTTVTCSAGSAATRKRTPTSIPRRSPRSLRDGQGSVDRSMGRSERQAVNLRRTLVADHRCRGTVACAARGRRTSSRRQNVEREDASTRAATPGSPCRPRRRVVTSAAAQRRTTSVRGGQRTGDRGPHRH